MNRLGRPRIPRAALLARYAVDDAGCWVWQGPINRYGYGKFTVAGDAPCTRVTRSAHRASYEHHVGPIPAGLCIDHLCRNRACINPAHLEPVTVAENLRRGRVARMAA